MKSPKWVESVIKALDEAGVRFSLLDAAIGLFDCKSSIGGRSYRFYASGGVIVGSAEKGIAKLIDILTKGEAKRNVANNYSKRNNARGFYGGAGNVGSGNLPTFTPTRKSGAWSLGRNSGTEFTYRAFAHA